MATDYEQISSENVKRYGTAINEYGPLLLAERYSDHTHFVYELLQNAEDALGWRMSQESGFTKSVKFSLDSEALVFSHYGLPFSEEHVRAICEIGKGTKKQDLTAIGKHGIGFKSVYAYTQHPEVHSGNEHFVINLFVQPHGITSKQTKLDETLFFLPFDRTEVKKDKAYQEIANRLKKLGLKTLLFLRNIESISWQLISGETGTYLRDSKQIEKGVDQVTLLGEVSGHKELMEEWLVFSKPVKNNDSEAGFIEIAFALTTDSKTSKPLIVRAPESPLAVFFPTEKETNFGFLIQGPYRTTPSRDNIPKDEPWNQYLVSETAQFLVSSLRKVRELGFLTVSALEAMVLDPTKYQSDSQTGMFRPICDAILAALRTERLIPQFGGGYVAANNGRLARAENLRVLLSPKQLQDFAGSTEEMGWIDGDITRNLTPTLFPFLMNQVNVKEIDAEDFVRDVSTDFLTQQSDDWIAKFYTFLLELPFLRNKSWFPGKEIIRLENNSHVKPFDSRSTPNAYLPGNMATGFPTVKRTICQNVEAMKFIKALGLKEPDPVDDVIQNVLPRYKAESDVIPSEYAEDIQKIVEAYKTDSTSRRNDLIRHLCDVAWVRCRNAASGNILLKVPGSAYLPTQKLRQLFEGISVVWFVDREMPFLQGKQIQDVLEAAGVSEYLTKIEVSCGLSSEQLRKIRMSSGLERYSSFFLEDFDIDGLLKVIENISLVNSETGQILSFVLWECLRDVLRERREGFFCGNYTWSYFRESKEKSFPAKFVRLLQETPWLPSTDGTLKKPSQVCFAELPQQFQNNPSPFLVDLLEFKPNEVKQLAEKTGISEEILDMIRGSGLSAEQLRELLGLNKPPVVSPTEGSGSPGTAGSVGAAIDNILGTGHNPPTPPPDNNEGGGFSGTSSVNKGSGHGTGSGSGGRATTHSTGSSQRTEFHSYVGIHTSDPAHNGDETDEQKLALENAAIQFIKEQDGDQFAEIRRMPQMNEGYDLEAINEQCEVVRYIEVKAMRCAWVGRPATLSSPQFKKSQLEEDKFWLYVVEKAGQPEAKIYRIQNPSGKTSYFTLDDGWSNIAEEKIELNGTIDETQEKTDLPQNEKGLQSS
jgi:hypothetical protein